MDHKEINRTRTFLCIKVKIDLHKPLNRGTVIKYQDIQLRVFFKYERLPTFCFACGRISHQLKDCEELGGNGLEDFKDIEESELSFGLWLKASPLPKSNEEPIKDHSSGSFSRNLFESPSQSGGSGSGRTISVRKGNQQHQGPNGEDELKG
ncbi:unnamed protein product [Vicia faba]|uniref:CCHC-type domain-containing protein n=1 Tax=Vicia faba TaxID=3906 RepID=A0AAV0YT70_VICFA|nr:unnamed protein product [Vicia faba]